MKLDSDRKLTGKIQSIEDESFTIVDSKASQSTSLAFSEVKEIQQKRFPGWAWGAIIGGAIFGLLMLGASGVIGEGIG